MQNPLEFDVEPLERRRMLTASLDFNPSSGLLRITGDSNASVVQLDGLGTIGSIEAQVDGSFAGTFRGVHRIVANLGDGADVLTIAAISIGGSIKVNMGDGGDQLQFRNTVSNAGNGVDGDLQVGGKVTIKMGNDTGDFVSFATPPSSLGQTFGNHVTVLGAGDVDFDGTGTGSEIEESDINILGNLAIRVSGLGTGSPSGNFIRLDNVNVGGTTKIVGSSNEDPVLFFQSSFARRVTVNLGAGDDFFTSFSTFFGHAAKLRGGAGTDTLSGAANTFVVPPTIDFEMII